jgi:peroxiredoxin
MKATSVQDAFEKICATEAPLHERMAAFSEAVREFGLPFAEAYDDLVARIRSGEAGSTAPAPGEPMPEFLLPGSSGRLVSLDDLIADGPAVISVNRGHWCEYCRIELTAFRQGMNEIAAQGANVVSIMPESEAFTGKAATANAGNAFKILSDIDNGYALTVGLAIWLGDRVRTLYLSHGLNLERFQNSPNWFVLIPATFVVVRDGMIVARHVDPDFRNRMDIEAIVAALNALRS